MITVLPIIDIINTNKRYHKYLLLKEHSNNAYLSCTIGALPKKVNKIAYRFDGTVTKPEN